jgi:thioredoxin 1
MKPIEITRDNFTEEVANSPVPVLIDLWAPWCGPCRMMSPVIDEIAESAEGFKVGKVNVDEQMEIAASLRVRSIPTLVVFKNGEVAAKSIGVQSKEEVLKLLDA